MTQPTGARRAATHADLQELHGLLVAALLAKLKDPGNLPAEWADVARALLKQEGPGGRAQEDADVQALQRLHKLLAKKLAKALSAPEPSATVLAVARGFLQDNGITKDLGGALVAAQASKVLADADLPFNTLPH